METIEILKIIQNQSPRESVRIRNFSGPYFLAFALHTDQKNPEYGHFSCSECTQQ